MKKLQSKLQENRFIFLSFLLTAMICCVIYKLRHVSPFGSESILRVDLFHQYAPFLEELRSRILNGQSLAYSWESALGKDFLTQMAYYTASPLDFLVLLFPERLIAEFTALLVILKTSICSSTFSYYLKKHFQRNDLSIVIFALFYAFCGFMTCYYWNTMWLDTVALFPLVALGTEKIVKENKHLFYYVALTLTMIVNFYLAVLVCIFTALYFLLCVFSAYSWKENYKVIIQRTFRFGITSILCALTAMFILLPVVIALGQTATSETAFPGFGIYDNIYQILTCHFIGARPAVLARNQDLPNVFSGVLTMMLLPAYLFNREIPKKDKLLRGAFLIFVLLCCIIKPLDFVIHGFHFPANLPHRFVFMYSFMLIIMAYEAFTKIKSFDYKWTLCTAGIYTAVILITEYLIVPRIWGIKVTLSTDDVFLNLILFVVYLVLIYLLQNSKKIVSPVLLVVLLIFAIGESVFSGYDGLYDTGDHDGYVAYLDGAAEANAAISEQEEDLFYRTEFRRLAVINEGTIYHYNGFSQFSSLAPGGTSAFIKNIGIAATSNSYRYYDPTPLTNAMFDMKYLLNRDKPLTKDYYTEIGQFDNVYAYRNERNLSLGFLVDQEVTDWDLDATNPFLVQNDFIKKSTSVEEDMFTLIDADYINVENMNVTYTDGDKAFDYTLDNPADLETIPRFTAQYTSAKDQYLYLYVVASNAKRFVYHTSREDQDREIACGNAIIDVGHVSAGEVITIECELTNMGEFETEYRSPGKVSLYAASYNDSVFQKAYDELSQGCMTITDFTDTHFEGTVSASKDQVLFTSIPYVDGWSVTLDGEPVDKVSLGNDGVIGVAIPAGDHELTFTYKLKGLRYAVVFSVLGVLLMIGYLMLEKKGKLPAVKVNASKTINHPVTEVNTSKKTNLPITKVNATKGGKKKKRHGK